MFDTSVIDRANQQENLYTLWCEVSWSLRSYDGRFNFIHNSSFGLSNGEFQEECYANLRIHFSWQFDAVQHTRNTQVHYLCQLFPKCAPRIPAVPRSISKFTREYISVMALNFTYILN